MPDRITVLTPTCDRPVAFALCERWMAAQTRQPDEWIVADGGRTPVVCTRGQRHLHQAGLPGARNFTANLLRGLEAATGDILALVEDDDYYQPGHLAQLRSQMTSAVQIAGDPFQRYYHVPSLTWKLFENTGASLCQTAMRRDAFPWFRRAIQEARLAGRYGVDFALWQQAPLWAQSLERSDTVVGLKGLPGRPGLGIGHRPRGPGWIRDHEAVLLRHWLGPDAEVVLGAMTVPALAEPRREAMRA
jgi:glycosyltransferase involved in cell wall biosynthesis